MSEPLDARTHIYRHRPEVAAESALIAEHVTCGTRALDVGTGATGRTALLLHEAGAEVHSIEINAEALAEFSASPECQPIHVAQADMCQLPFADESFGVVMIGLHGSDYLLDPASRRRAFAEAGRVLRPGGVLVFNAFNPVGMALSPSGLRNAEFRRARTRYIGRCGFLRRTLIDVNGLRLHQATPRRIIAEVERAGPLCWTTITNQSGSTRSKWLVALLAAAPYYVFERPSG